MQALLNISNLATHFFRKDGILKAVDGIDIKINAGETLALVGESGSGKTVTALSILDLVPHPGKIISGTIRFNGREIGASERKQVVGLRGKEIGLILQDSASALNPVKAVGEQVAEVLRHHFRLARKPARIEAIQWLRRVQLPAPETIYHAYPHQLSGGMRQRVLIAIALCCKPALVIADEPTSALDVSIQNQILVLLGDLQEELHIALLLITHDLGVVARMADHVAVMYAGKIVEQASARDWFARPSHPYSQALIRTMPGTELAGNKRGAHPPALPGSVPDLMHIPNGCAFHPRCAIATPLCQRESPAVVHFANGGYVACHKRKEEHEALAGSIPAPPQKFT